VFRFVIHEEDCPLPTANKPTSKLEFCELDKRLQWISHLKRKAGKHDTRIELGQPEAGMEFSSSREWINALWSLFGLYWLLSALKRKKTKQRETWAQRFAYVLPLVGAFWLLRQPLARYGLLGERFVPAGPAMEWTGVVLTGAGVALAIWARWHLGTNWSGTVTLKEGHELIRTGPYRTVRHPIYTGILLALLGTAFTAGQVRGLVAVAIAWASFYFKARREEAFLTQEFGEKFGRHAKETGMFLPKIASN
jgi:protein-S-isoprenylcysteine O-methyltransferase Ste14